MPYATERARTTRIVQSRHNPRVKELRAALERPGKLASGLIAIEGERMLAEALRSGLTPQILFIESGRGALLDRLGQSREARARLDSAEVLELPAEILRPALATESPQGIAALLMPPQFTPADLFPADRPALVLVAAALQDPGNVGTLIRSAEAFGATGLLLLSGSVYPWNPKVVRSSAGSVFRLPVVAASIEQGLNWLREHRVRLYATAAEGDLPSTEAALAAPCAIAIGNEGAGLAPELLAASDARLSIPCPGPVESLNAAVAGSILLYEAARQREAARPREATRGQEAVRSGEPSAVAAGRAR